MSLCEIRDIASQVDSVPSHVKMVKSEVAPLFKEPAHQDETFVERGWRGRVGGIPPGILTVAFRRTERSAPLPDHFNLSIQ